MCGPVSGAEYSSKWTVTHCCCGCTLRTGCLILGWLDFIGGILSILSMAFGQNAHGSSYLGSFIISLVVGLLLLVGTYKLNSQFIWAAVYVTLVQLVVSMVMIIVSFVYLAWGVAIGIAIGFVINVYFFLVIRSYGYEVEAGRGGPMVSPA